MYFIKLLLIAILFEITASLGISEKKETKPVVKVFGITQTDTTKADNSATKGKSPRALPIQISLP